MRFMGQGRPWSVVVENVGDRAVVV